MSIYQQRQALEELKEENQTLRQILTSHGIPFEAELERRKAARAAGGASSQQGSSFPGSAPQSVVFSGNTNTHTHSTADTSVSPGRSPGAYPDPPDPNSSGLTLPYHGGPYQPSHAGVSEYSSIGEGGGALAKTAGVFESDPQLKIDFILGYVFVSRRLGVSNMVSASNDIVSTTLNASVAVHTTTWTKIRRPATS